jgi:hypothetical protein
LIVAAVESYEALALVYSTVACCSVVA